MRLAHLLLRHKMRTAVTTLTSSSPTKSSSCSKSASRSMNMSSMRMKINNAYKRMRILQGHMVCRPLRRTTSRRQRVTELHLKMTSIPVDRATMLMKMTDTTVEGLVGRQKKPSKSKSRRRERSIDDDLEGGAFRESARHEGESSESDEDSDDSGSDVSVSSDDSDVKIIREPIIPKWMSWNNLTRFVDRTVRDPVVNVSSKVYSTLVPGSTPEPKKSKRDNYAYDEEGGSGSGSGSESESGHDDGEADHADISLNIQPLALNKKQKHSKQKAKKASSVGYTLPSTNVIFSNISHFLSLSTVTTLFTTQQKEWLQQTYDATTTSIWSYVTNTAEILVDGQPQRRGQHEGGEEPQPLPP
mmetsp:Transcript_16981/g.31959  ORF Transcript_16981/g.31959 Transcript_16981/m.31959 type:complete len:358 (-) Transcript_16981:104-1177(-)